MLLSEADLKTAHNCTPHDSSSGDGKTVQTIKRSRVGGVRRWGGMDRQSTRDF